MSAVCRRSRTTAQPQNISPFRDFVVLRLAGQNQMSHVYRTRQCADILRPSNIVLQDWRVHEHLQDEGNLSNTSTHYLSGLLCRVGGISKCAPCARL